MKRYSTFFKLFCLLAIIAIALSHIFLHFGPNDSEAGAFADEVVAAKYGTPPPNVYVGNGPPPTVKLWWHIINYKADPDKKSGIYTIGFQHMTQEGPSITKVQGQLTCHYDANTKSFTLLSMQTMQ